MTHSRRYVLCPIGSAGDIFPFIAVGQALARRGREVLFLATDNFRPAATAAGLPFEPTFSSEHFQRVKEIEDLWHPRRGVGVVMNLISDEMRDAYALLERVVDPEKDVLALHLLSFAGRVHQEVHGTAGSTLHLAPSAYRSNFAQPTMLPGVSLNRLPRFLKRSFWYLVDRFFLDPSIAPKLNAWRAELGLPPVHRLFRDWIHAPEGTIALFPDIFGPRQPDWPQPFESTSFALWDGVEEIEAGLAAWLEEGPPPLVFTPGSANLHSEDFGRAASGVAKLLDRRVLYLASKRAGLEDANPDLVRFESWAPLGSVMTRACALIHHGGIGTTARGLLSGRPQLIMPMGFDQPDNAARVERLGVGGWLKPGDFNTERVAAKLTSMLESETMAARCQEVAARIGVNGADRVAEILIARHES